MGSLTANIVASTVCTPTGCRSGLLLHMRHISSLSKSKLRAVLSHSQSFLLCVAAGTAAGVTMPAGNSAPSTVIKAMVATGSSQMAHAALPQAGMKRSAAQVCAIGLSAFSIFADLRQHCRCVACKLVIVKVPFRLAPVLHVCPKAVAPRNI